MAEGRQSSLMSSFKEDFDDQLTCSVCLDQYTNPKTLPCLHSFCLLCIEQLPVVAVQIEDGKYYISCPTCRVDHLLPQGGANSLPNAFQINSLLDLRTKLLTTNIATSTSQSTCPQHNDLLTVYCETCCRVICRDCTISTEHNKHTFYLISECYPKHHQQILGSLDLVKHKVADMNTAITHLDTREIEVVEQGENVKEQIYTHAEQLISNIQQSSIHLAQKVNSIVQQKRQTLATQRQQAQKLHTQLNTCQDMIENYLNELNQQQILSKKITMMNEMKAATEHVDPLVFQPIELDTNIQYDKTEKAEMGSITGIAYCNATLNLSPPYTAKQQATATLTLNSTDDSPFSLPPSLISSELSSPGDKQHSVKCPITHTQPGKYKITFTPSTRNDQLIVQVGGIDVLNDSFALPFIPTPELRGEPVNIITELNKPWGIAVFNIEDIVVAENGAHCVTVLNKKGEKVKTFTQFNSPRGVAISMDGHILVTDDHRLQKLTSDGFCVKSVSSGYWGQFNSPQGIAVTSTTGQIFVADHGNNRIQVFSNDLTFSHTISPARFSLSPQFNHPLDLAATDNGEYLYIVDKRNDGVFAVSFPTARSYIYKFKSSPADFHPSSLTIHNGLVYVSQCYNDCILVFDKSGKFQSQFKVQTKLNRPQSMYTDVFGNMYISDTDNNRIVVI